jgi:hypothetical protein
MLLLLFLSSNSSYPVPLYPSSHCSLFSVTLFLSLSSLSSSCSSSLSLHIVPLILFPSPSHLSVPLILLLCFFPCPLLVLLHVPFLFPVILFLLSCSSLPVISLFPYPVTLFLSLSSLSSASCSSFLSFPLILFLLSCSSLSVISLFPYPLTPFLFLSILSSASVPLNLFLSPSHLTVPLILLLTSCPLLRFVFSLILLMFFMTNLFLCSSACSTVCFFPCVPSFILTHPLPLFLSLFFVLFSSCSSPCPCFLASV